MNTTLIKRRLKTSLLTGICLVGFTFISQASVSTFTWGSSGSPIGQVDAGSSESFPLTSVQDLSGQGMDPTISSVELILTFNDNGALRTDGSGIQGNLVLGTDIISPYVTFNPVQTSTSGGNSIYDVTFSGSGSSFSGLNPNGIWSLVLWNNDGNIGNQLNSFTLDITAVPEPTNVALAILGVIFFGTVVVQVYRAFRPAKRPVGPIVG